MIAKFHGCTVVGVEGFELDSSVSQISIPDTSSTRFLAFAAEYCEPVIVWCRFGPGGEIGSVHLAVLDRGVMWEASITDIDGDQAIGELLTLVALPTDRQERARDAAIAAAKTHG